MNKSNIILIGMPGSGKSSVGVILAKKTARSYIDTDVLIQTAEGRSLQTIIDTEGYLALRDIEENYLLKLHCTNHVISTGGSAAYSDAAMNHLKNSGVTIFLYVNLPTLINRVQDYETRGVTKRADQTFEDLFNERIMLYKKHADFTINSSEMIQEEVCKEIIEYLK
jgi:shikimate kinase